MRDTIRSNGVVVYVYVYMYFFLFSFYTFLSLCLSLSLLFLFFLFFLRYDENFSNGISRHSGERVLHSKIVNARAIGERCVLNPVPYKTSPEDSHSNSAVELITFDLFITENIRFVLCETRSFECLSTCNNRRDGWGTTFRNVYYISSVCSCYDRACTRGDEQIYDKQIYTLTSMQ